VLAENFRHAGNGTNSPYVELSMQARRAIAILVSCVLGVCLLTAASSGHPVKHTVRGVAVLAVSTPDQPHTARHASDGVVAAAPAVTAAQHVASGTSDTSQRASFRTAQTSLIRGPPAQALA
jgi:hypothetical protein